jgi:hypothetical protein
MRESRFVNYSSVVNYSCLERRSPACCRGGVSPEHFDSKDDMKRYLSLAAVLWFTTVCFAADCIPFEQAKDHIGSNACVTGKVLKVGHTRSGTTFLDFCEDVKSCPFTVVIFARDLRDVGDVSLLEGKTIEIGGKIEEYNGRAEIILKDVKQLRGEAAAIPPLPKNYDVEKHGNFSATAKSAPSSTTKKTTTTQRKQNLGPKTVEEE